MSEIARAIIVDSSSSFALIMVAFFGLLAVVSVAYYIFLASRSTDRGKMHQVQLLHEEKMAELKAQYPILLGRDVAETHHKLRLLERSQKREEEKSQKEARSQRREERR